MLACPSLLTNFGALLHGDSCEHQLVPSRRNQGARASPTKLFLISSLVCSILHQNTNKRPNPIFSIRHHSPDQEIVPAQPIALILQIRPERQPTRGIVVGHGPAPDQVEVGCLRIDPVQRARDLPALLERQRDAQEVFPPPPFLFRFVRSSTQGRNEDSECVTVRGDVGI